MAVQGQNDGILSQFVGMFPAVKNSAFGRWIDSFSPLQQGFLAGSLIAFVFGVIAMLSGSTGMGLAGMAGGLLMGGLGLAGPRDTAGYREMVGMKPEGWPQHLDMVHQEAWNSTTPEQRKEFIATMARRPKIYDNPKSVNEYWVAYYGDLVAKGLIGNPVNVGAPENTK